MAGGMNPMAESVLWAPTGQGTVPTHPLYLAQFPDWLQMVDTYMGERRVKEQGTKYLPATMAMEEDGMTPNAPGWKAYQAYKKRAIFHDIIGEAIRAMVGVMHRKPPRIEVPDKLEPLLKRATPTDEPIQLLLRKINEQQLLNARIGLLLEAPTGVDVNQALPWIVPYPATALVNWDVGTQEIGERRTKMVVLNESEWERRSTFNWAWEVKHRVLCADPVELVPDWAAGSPRGYAVNILRDGRTDPDPAQFIFPSIGGRNLGFVPFVFVNANDLVPEPETPPLLGLGNLALAIYRGEADYRQNLFLQGQDTLVMTGMSDAGGDIRTGASAGLKLPKGADAKYIGVSAAGLDGQRKALQDLDAEASDRGAKLLDFNAGRASSGDALRIRVAARTTNLFSVARTGCYALERILKMAAEWIGENPDKVVVEPNLDFTEADFGGQDLSYFMQAKRMGAPISLRSIHNILKARDVTDMDYDEEIAEIESEGSGLGTGGSRGVPGTARGGDPLTDGTSQGNVDAGANKSDADVTGLNQKTSVSGSQPGGPQDNSQPGGGRSK